MLSQYRPFAPDAESIQNGLNLRLRDLKLYIKNIIKKEEEANNRMEESEIIKQLEKFLIIVDFISENPTQDTINKYINDFKNIQANPYLDDETKSLLEDSYGYMQEYFDCFPMEIIDQSLQANDPDEEFCENVEVQQALVQFYEQSKAFREKYRNDQNDEELCEVFKKIEITPTDDFAIIADLMTEMSMWDQKKEAEKNQKQMNANRSLSIFAQTAKNTGKEEESPKPKRSLPF